MSDGSGMQGSAGRDFGDSAGYGGGGSTRDYRDVLGENELRRPNPLDAVMTIPPHRRRAGARRSEGGPARAERDPSSDLVTAAAVMLVASLGVLGWRHARDLRSRRMRRHRRAEGETRETLARLQV
jgi:hypothetical protein